MWRCYYMQAMCTGALDSGWSSHVWAYMYEQKIDFDARP
jgi:hypothetical protein